jgi:rRNA maturation endonuclease Nob1
MKDWITCSECEEDFRVVTDSLNPISFCPLCGEDILEEDEDEDYGFED